MDLTRQIQILDKVICISLHANAKWERYESIYLTTDVGKTVEKTSASAPIKVENKLNRSNKWVICSNFIQLLCITTINMSLSYAASMDFDSFAIHPNHPLIPAGLLDCILCPYGAVVKFLLVGQHLHVCQKGSIYEFILASPAEFRKTCLSYLDSFRDRR